MLPANANYANAVCTMHTVILDFFFPFFCYLPQLILYIAARERSPTIAWIRDQSQVKLVAKIKPANFSSTL